MASLYRKPVITKDPVTGQKTKTQSKKWWGQYKDADGRLRRHPLSVDKMAAQSMLNAIVRRIEREKSGLVEPSDAQRKRPISQHVEEFKSYLENKGVTAVHAKSMISQLNKTIASCKWRRISEITP